MDQAIITKSDLDQDARRGARWTLIGCSALVFITSVCIMVLELTASRLIAKAVGSSLYTWTSVIGVILAGISIGNFLGGWLADRYDHRRSLAWLFFISSFCCMTIYPLSQLVSTRGRPEWVSWQAWVVIIVSSLFLHPSIVLGMISPITASMALAKARHTGSTVGNVYAWGAMGSIIGTFLAGFYLISMFGTQHIIWMTAATLALLGIVVATGQRMFRGAMIFGWMQLIFWIGMLASARESQASAEDRVWLKELLGKTHELGLKLNLRGDDPDEYNAESDYFYINVANRHQDGDTVKSLHLDHLTHSYYNPNDPTALYYDYEKVYAAVTERAAETWDRESVVPLPNGLDEGWKLPSWTKYDPAAKKLSIRGAINSKKLNALLNASPSGEFWDAVQELTSEENMKMMSGLSSVGLEKLPPDTMIPEALKKKIQHDETLGTLIRYQTVTDAEREALYKLAPHNDYRLAVEELYGQSRRTSTMFLGGGGFVFPRWIEANFPKEPLIHVLELDPAVKLAVQREMGLPDDDKTYVRTLLGDARNSVDDLLNGMALAPGATGKHNHYDFIYGDAFNDFSVPWHLTTKEFAEKIKTLLTPNEGVFLVNIIDIYPRAEAPVYTGELPAAMLPTVLERNRWVLARAPYDFLEIKLQDTPKGVELRTGKSRSVILGLRGVMSAAREEELVKFAGSDAELQKTFRMLSQKSRESKPGRFLGAYVNTVCQVYPNVYVFSANEGLPSASRDTFVVACSLKPLSFSDLKRSGGYWGTPQFAAMETKSNNTQVYSSQMTSILELARGMTLTDDYAPVDNLLIPVFADQ